MYNMKLLTKNPKYTEIRSFYVTKRILHIGVFAFIIMNSCYAQVTRANTKVNTNKAINIQGKTDTNPILVSKVNMRALEGAKYSKKLKVNSLRKVTISKTDLLKRSRKKSRINPLKPYTSTLQIDYHGAYSKDAFILMQRPLDNNNAILKYSALVKFNAQRGKEYRMKIVVDSAPAIGTVILEIGGAEYTSEIGEGTTEINFVFTAKDAGYLVFGISPLQVEDLRTRQEIPSFRNYPPIPNPFFGASAQSMALPIKYIQIDEI